jgi:hypothetical protein
VTAAISCLIAQEQDAAKPPEPARSAWRAAAASEAVGLPPARNSAGAAWHAADRARRAGRWSFGIVGM